MRKLEEKARHVATEAHNRVNQTYGNKLPYTFHLELVNRMAEKYIQLIPYEDIDVVKAACWLHDTLEDTFLTYNDLKTALTEYWGGMTHNNSDEVHRVCEIVFAVTNNKGRNRKERADAKYYEGIRNTQYATFVKLCDRLANVFFSLLTGNDRMFEMYKNEHKDFMVKLYVRGQYERMYDDLLGLFQNKTFSFEVHRGKKLIETNEV